IPPLPYPRRMWAGGRLEFLNSLGIGAPVERRSTVADLSAKEGSTGAFAILMIRHELFQHGQLCIVEEQDLVFRGAAAPETPQRAAPAPGEVMPDLLRTIEPDPTLLFRFSALTFNAHRI